MPTPPLQFLQSAFDGGLNQRVDASRLGANEYPLLINGRNRFGVIEPIKTPIDRTPSGIVKIQGCYAAASFSVLFADGKAFYRDETRVDSSYYQVDGLQMSAAATYIYACAVPASTVNTGRKLANSANVNQGVLFSSAVNSSPQCLVVQDGLNQPWIILPDGSARVTNNYNQWQNTSTGREYVPIGRQMLWHDGILYIVSTDGSLLMRSVTGRPLDFMVIVRDDGTKEPSEADGGAAQIAHKVDYAPITALAPLSAPDGDFYVATARTSYAVRPNFDITPYSEPSFDNIFLFTTGPVNNFSFADVLGDTTLIDYSGIRSFNSVGQYRVEGKNSPFSAKINKLISDLRQETPCAESFDNYGLFYVNTIFGAAIMVYDTITQAWTSMDLMPALVGKTPLMFATVKTNTTRKLLLATTSKLFELYSDDSTSTETPGYYSPEFNSNDPGVSQKPTHVQLTFVDIKEPGSVWLTPIADSKKGTQKTVRIGNLDVAVQTTTPPVLDSARDKVRTVTVPLIDTAKDCWKIGLYVRWNFDGKLSSLKLLSNSVVSSVSYEDQVKSTATLGALSVDGIYVRLGLIGGAGSSMRLSGVGFSSTETITVNGVEVPAEFVEIVDDETIIVTFGEWSSENEGDPVLEVVVVNGFKFKWFRSIDESADKDNASVGIHDVFPPLTDDDEDGTEDPGDVVIVDPSVNADADSGGDASSSCECTVMANDTTNVYSVDMGDGRSYTVMQFPLGCSRFAWVALLFEILPNGKYKLLSPLLVTDPADRDYDFREQPPAPILQQIGLEFGAGDGTVTFSFGDQDFCVVFDTE